MTTKAQLLNAATLVVDCLQREEARPELKRPDTAARELAASIIEAMYYRAPDSVRKAFDYEIAALFRAAGWE